jgi:hAT family C-terminal dimerisation region
LGWWKIKGKEYHILSRIARDVLVVPVSIVASKPTFSTGGRVINPYRNKLGPKAVEALICLQDWIRGDKKYFFCVYSLFKKSNL